MRLWKSAALVLAMALPACAGDSAPAPAPKEVAAAPAPVAAPVPAATDVASAPAPMVGTLPGDRLPSITATVIRGGAASQAADLATTKGVKVLVVMSTTCPFCAEAVGPLRRAEAAFQSRGVDFVYLYPLKAETAEVKAAWHAAKGFQAGLVDDAGAVVSKLLKADKTPTAYLVDARGVLLYRGAVIEGGEGGGPANYRLADAIDEVLAGKPVSVPAAEPAG